MERRRFIRVPFRAPVTGISPRFRVQAEAENLSIKGVYVRTAEAMDPNERVWLLLALPDDPPSDLVIPGTVIRRDEYGIGVEFAPMDIDTFLVCPSQRGSSVRHYWDRISFFVQIMST